MKVKKTYKAPRIKSAVMRNTCMLQDSGTSSAKAKGWGMGGFDEDDEE